MDPHEVVGRDGQRDSSLMVLKAAAEPPCKTRHCVRIDQFHGTFALNCESSAKT